MDRSTVQAAVTEARRFIERAEALLDAEVEIIERVDGQYEHVKRPWRGGYDAPKQSGAARRASLDLTRALAEMRRR